jgi:hypothetical protein|tara:strand:- start:212 stop:508 length:297 start_codon:yes stop_codon:yes gene_type:complete
MSNNHTTVSAMYFSVTPGVTRFRTVDINPNDFKWNKNILSLGPFDNVGSTIEYTEDHKDFKYILRPLEPRLKDEFEKLFEFGMGCTGFTKDKFIAITN